MEQTIAEQIRSRRKALTLREFSELLNVSYKTLYGMVSEGRLPVIRIGAAIRVDPKTAAQWLEQRTIG